MGDETQTKKKKKYKKKGGKWESPHRGGTGGFDMRVKNKKRLKDECASQCMCIYKKIGSFVCALKAGKQKGEKKNCVKLKYGCCS